MRGVQWTVIADFAGHFRAKDARSGFPRWMFRLSVTVWIVVAPGQEMAKVTATYSSRSGIGGEAGRRSTRRVTRYLSKQITGCHGS